MGIRGRLPTEQWWPWNLTYHHSLYGLAVVSTLPSLEITLLKARSLKSLRHELVETVWSPDFPVDSGTWVPPLFLIKGFLWKSGLSEISLFLSTTLLLWTAAPA